MNKTAPDNEQKLKIPSRQPGKWKVRVRSQLYVTGPGMAEVIAGPRLLKGNTSTHAVPEINFASDEPTDADKQRKALEKYLNDWHNQKD